MNQRVMLTKSLLKKSLTELLSKQSIYQISIRELCEAAGINRSTFYKYYGSQFDLLAEMEKDLMTDIEAYLNVNKGVYDPQSVIQIFYYLDSNIELVKLLLNSNVDPDFPDKLFTLSKVKILLKELAQAYTSEDKTDYSYNFMLAGAYHIICVWANKEKRESPEWMTEFLCDQLLAKQFGER